MANQGEDPIWLEKYFKIYDDVFMKFIEDSKSVGDDVKSQADIVKKAFDVHREIMTIAGRNGKPNDSDLQAIFKPLSSSLSTVEEFRDKNRASKQLNFLSAVADGIPFLGWIAVAPSPGDYVLQMVESAQFYANKVLKEFRTSEPTLANWSKSWIELIKTSQKYVNEHHSTGLQWNEKKPAATAALAPSVDLPTIAPCSAPPPPPVQLSSGVKVSRKTPSVKTGDTDALFAEINKGSQITAGLKKVTKDMQTHKNPELREKAPIVAKSAPKPAARKTKTEVVKKPPVFTLQQKQWLVEWQEDNQDLVIDRTNIKQTVYIFKCTNCIIHVKGKVNTITMDSCKKCGIVFEDIISACEFVNCESVKAQPMGDVPTISVEKTDGAQIYLTKKNLNVQIITSKSSEMNVCVAKDDGDLTEYPICEQYKTEWDGKKFTTTPMELTS